MVAMSGQHFEQAKRTAETLLHWSKMGSIHTEVQMAGCVIEVMKIDLHVAEYALQTGSVASDDDASSSRLPCVGEVLNDFAALIDARDETIGRREIKLKK